MLRKSEQQLLDEQKCRPGYRYLKAIDECLPAYAGGGSTEEDKPAIDPPKDVTTPEQTPPPGETEKPARAQAKAKAKAVKASAPVQ